jgi:hypothetical protein
MGNEMILFSSIVAFVFMGFAVIAVLFIWDYSRDKDDSFLFSDDGLLGSNAPTSSPSPDSRRSPRQSSSSTETPEPEETVEEPTAPPENLLLSHSESEEQIAQAAEETRIRAGRENGCLDYCTCIAHCGQRGFSCSLCDTTQLVRCQAGSDRSTYYRPECNPAPPENLLLSHSEDGLSIPSEEQIAQAAAAAAEETRIRAGRENGCLAYCTCNVQCGGRAFPCSVCETTHLVSCQAGSDRSTSYRPEC